MKEASIQNLKQLTDLLSRLPNPNYVYKSTYLSDSSIGEHTRHVVEFYQCLTQSVENELIVNYDLRIRNKLIESTTNAAIDAIEEIGLKIQTLDLYREVMVEGDFMQDAHPASGIISNVYRELLYCYEHCIHHQALIKISLMEQGLSHLIGKDFGVANSTIMYKKKCVQ